MVKGNSFPFFLKPQNQEDRCGLLHLHGGSHHERLRKKNWITPLFPCLTTCNRSARFLINISRDYHLCLWKKLNSAGSLGLTWHPGKNPLKIMLFFCCFFTSGTCVCPLFYSKNKKRKHSVIVSRPVQAFLSVDLQKTCIGLQNSTISSPNHILKSEFELLPNRRRSKVNNIMC